ncbi:MAG: hypothetical protein JRF33_05055 [Deltaproteobacteria bacterium]|nr:hypothetical protein [Deltaproteobacteria bacterium]
MFFFVVLCFSCSRVGYEEPPVDCEDLTCINCGDGEVNRGEDCDPEPPQGDHCCNPVTCRWVALDTEDPQAVCAGAPECKVDACDGAGGCIQTNATDGISCSDDGLYCTGEERCQGGTCISAGNPCPQVGDCQEDDDICLGCGDGLVSNGEDCDPGVPQGDHCCDPSACTWIPNGGPDPQLVCVTIDSCRLELCGDSGTCIEYRIEEGGACIDQTLDDCLAARCDSTGVCDQSAAFEALGTRCDNGLYCDGPDVCGATGICDLHLGDPCGASVARENFDSFTEGEVIGDQVDWFGASTGPTLRSSASCDASIGLAPATLGYTWLIHPFRWQAEDFTRLVVGADFQSSNQSEFHDDRLGWTLACDTTDSSLMFGVQLDNVRGLLTEAYWDGPEVNNLRVPIADIDSLISRDSWYRLRATFTKLTDTSARIDVSLWELDGACDPVEPPIIIESIPDTSALGVNAPDHKYFNADIMWPVFKNAGGIQGGFDNVYIEIVYGEGGVCEENEGTCQAP